MTEDLKKANSLEERIPDNVFETSCDGLSYSLHLKLGSVWRDIGELMVYFSRNAEDYSAVGFYEWARGRKISPALMLKGFRDMVRYEYLNATLEMFDLWAGYSIAYLGEDEGERYVSKELGVPVSSASEREKLDAFVPRRERGGGSIASL